MPGVFRDVVLMYEGEEVVVTPSLRLLRRIEQADISMADLAIRTQQGRPPVSHLAYVVAAMLQSAGRDVTEDDVYIQLMTSEDQEAINSLIEAVFTAFAPAVIDEKKLGPSAAPNRAQRRKAASKRATK